MNMNNNEDGCKNKITLPMHVFEGNWPMSYSMFYTVLQLPAQN